MSDLRLNYSKTSFQTILDILSDLDKVQKDGNYSIRGWGKEVLNHGLKQNDFDKKDSNGQKLFKSTIRQFKSYKIDLEDHKFIEVYDKTNRVKGGPYYCISPLGILFLFKFQDKFTSNSTIKMFEYFSKIGFNKNFGLKRNSWKFFNNIQINKAMKTMFDNLYFDYTDQRLIMTLYVFNPKSLNKIVLTQVIIAPSFIKIIKPNLIRYRNIVTLSELDFGIAQYIRNLLCYYLIQYSKKSEFKKIPKDFRLFFTLIIKSIQNNAIIDYTESEKKSIQMYGQPFTSKEISLLTKQRLKRVIEDLT